MTYNTQPDSGRIITSSDILLHDAETALLYEELRAAIDDGHESMTHSDALAEIAAIRAKNTELRAQLEAIGAGGVSGPLMGNEVMLHPDKRTHATAVKAYMDATHSGSDLTGAVDAAIAAQGGKDA